MDSRAFLPVLATLFCACGPGTDAQNTPDERLGWPATAGMGGGPATAGTGGAATAGSTGSAGATATAGAGGSTSGGGSGNGGSAGNVGGAGNGGSAGSGGSAGTAPHVVVSCDQVEVGKWEEITPPEMLATERWKKKNDGYGVSAIAIDPINTANVVLGSDKMGAYLTTDCGATWKHLNMGRGGAALDGGVGWSWAFDHYVSGTFYTVSGYGTMGVFKTTNAGKDWDQTLAPAFAKNFVSAGFTQHVRADPTTPAHLVISPHFFCENGHGGYCFMETTDGGSSWKVIDNKLADGTNLPGDEGTRLYVENHNVWFVGPKRPLPNGERWQELDAGPVYQQLCLRGLPPPWWQVLRAGRLQGGSER